MVITITAIFGICWVPDRIAHSIDYFSSLSVSFSAYAVIHTLVLFNSTVNPFVYALISQNFRKKLKGMICCRCTGSKGFRSTITKNPTSVRKFSDHGKNKEPENNVAKVFWMEATIPLYVNSKSPSTKTGISALSSLLISRMLSRETKYFRLFSHQNSPMGSEENIFYLCK